MSLNRPLLMLNKMVFNNYNFSLNIKNIFCCVKWNLQFDIYPIRLKKYNFFFNINIINIKVFKQHTILKHNLVRERYYYYDLRSIPFAAL